MEEKYRDNVALAERAQAGDEEALEQLVVQNMGLVKSLALRFTGRGTDFEDLMQIGSMGLVKAARSFDVHRGCAFSTYAVPLVLGEIRRFLRDDGPIKVSRVQKRLAAALMAEKERLSAEGISDAPISLLAERCGIGIEEAAAAMDAAMPLCSFEDPVGEDGGKTLEATLCDEEESERAFERLALGAAIEKLPCLRRRIVILRYFKDYSQDKTAKLLGLSQVKVSREEKKILAFLREELS